MATCSCSEWRAPDMLSAPHDGMAGLNVYPERLDPEQTYL
jgi:hypothetical protein